eukprot:snap_masked-scaffold_5-processed-gene-5.35-mRNA-1 protein AED:1.00 eAED:1.00 QI:0/0/0/0/1/1/3/0/79
MLCTIYGIPSLITSHCVPLSPLNGINNAHIFALAKRKFVGCIITRVLKYGDISVLTVTLCLISLGTLTLLDFSRSDCWE